MSAPADLLARARESAAKARLERALPRFQRVIGKLLGAGILVSSEPVPPYRGCIKISDYLWAAELEPRLFELLPALVLKCPGYFSDLKRCPSELRHLVRAIRRGEAEVPFHGVPKDGYLKWITRVGRRDKEPTSLKSFRLTQQDLRTLRSLQELGYSEVGAVRLGLQLALAQAQPDSA